MKSLFRRGATAGLVGGVLIGSLFAGVAQVLALTQEQIVQKLRPIPVFTITNPQGAPLVANPPNGQKGSPVAGVFITQKDAQAFLDTLKSKNPDLAKNVKVTPVSLAEIYQMEVSNQGKADALEFAFVPSQQQVDSALGILKQSGQQVQQFNGTPLFVARGGEKKGYLTIQQGGKAVIPMFFKKEDLQNLVERFKQQQPNDAAKIEIQVLNLEGVIEVMRTKNDPQLEQIVLIPPKETVEFIRSNMGNQQGGGQNKPAPAKPAPAPNK